MRYATFLPIYPYLAQLPKPEIMRIKLLTKDLLACSPSYFAADVRKKRALAFDKSVGWWIKI
jgi:hypothetical protein